MLWKPGRLHPTAYRGVSLSRTTGSLTVLAEIGLAQLRRAFRHRVDREVLRGKRKRQFDVCLAEQALHSLAAGKTHRPAGGGGQRHVRLREAPDRRALKNGEVLDDWRDLGDDLNRGRAGADDRDALTREVQTVIPTGGVHCRARERIDAVDVGQLRSRQHAPRVDEKPRRHGLAGVRLDRPEVAFVVEHHAQDLGVEPDLRPQTVFVDAVLGVGLQLPTGRIGAGPVRALLERELVGK